MKINAETCQINMKNNKKKFLLFCFYVYSMIWYFETKSYIKSIRFDVVLCYFCSIEPHVYFHCLSFFLSNKVPEFSIELLYFFV